MNDDNIVDLAEIRNQKQKAAEEKSAKSLPWALNEYIRLRNISIEQITSLRKLIKNFEENVLTFSKNKELSGPQIDEYLMNKLAVERTVIIMKDNDKIVKEHYPQAELVPFE